MSEPGDDQDEVRRGTGGSAQPFQPKARSTSRWRFVPLVDSVRGYSVSVLRVDVLAGPTSPTPAFALGAKTADPVTMYLNDIYTIGANLAGVPALSVPCGFVNDLPVGLQLIGPHFSEAKLLAAAHAFQRETDWHTRTPGAWQ